MNREDMEIYMSFYKIQEKNIGIFMGYDSD